MAKTVADVMQMVKDNEVKFVDFRFTDTRARSSTCPCRFALRRRQVRLGHAVRRFVDRRLEGHRGIRHAADAGPQHRQRGPFFEEPTLILTCDVIDPTDGKPYDRDPRSLAKRAEAYLKSSGLATPPSSARARVLHVRQRPLGQ